MLVKPELEKAFHRLYQWSSLLTAEQGGSSEEYLWTDAFLKLEDIIRKYTGQLIALTALQGAGKTILKINLNKMVPNAVELKWTTKDKINSIFKMLSWDRDREWGKTHVDEYGRPENIPPKELHKLPNVILIDLPDYDRKAHGKFRKVLEEIQAFWEALTHRTSLINYGSETYAQIPNVVIFYQKELWDALPHFFKGKHKEITLDTIPPERLIDYVKKCFEEPKIFTEKALMEIVSLSRGIFRWFKLYINICLDKKLVLIRQDYKKREKERAIPINIDNVKEWITFDQLIKEWNRELMQVFPRSLGHRKTAMKVRQRLIEDGMTPQSTIQREFFGEDGSDKKACSVFLKALEDHDYITRIHKGREKYVEWVKGR